ncbi:hypothetical protein MKX03_030991 [Papaver bracteatum]|nr:hypothetical protein MKX03_030991 [Papaver bracteatum]
MIILAYFVSLNLVAGSCLGSAAVVGTTITQTQFITDPETIVSSKDIFRLGFFSLGDSPDRFVGIWYDNIPWVANRDRPLNDSSGVLKIILDNKCY